MFASFRFLAWVVLAWVVHLLAFCAAFSATPSSAQEPTPIRPQAAPPIEATPAEQGAPAIEPANGIAVTWMVANRFRLFREERDFRRHVEASQGRTILETERALAEATQGRGW